MADPNAYPAPAVRRLRVYAFDPQASTRLETASINHAVIALSWESRWEKALRPGPTNEYLEVIDVDPVSGQFYEAVDLDHPHLLAQDGLAPSEGDPRFHQQMCFAVAMKTIRAFERALGRKMFWSPRWVPQPDDPNSGRYEPVERLRVYPHALREPNAYYSREKKALLFGYFRAVTEGAGNNLPGGWVFTALSHDIIVHETTHAILDGLHRRYAEPTSPDSLAFHEAFADIVALLSHFTLPEAVSDQIAARGGDLSNRSLLSGLARQFGEATGRYAALRDAIDDKGTDELPDATLLSRLSEPHERGAVLVAAVFDAFVTIYERRTADLMRIADVAGRADRAKSGSARLHPDLVGRLTAEATKSADHVLRMCLRALDYLPPVDVRFGEFLRAIVTADSDLIADDRLNYRLAMIEAFRRRGILPERCLSLAPDSLLWERPDPQLDAKDLIRGGKPGKPARPLSLEPKYQRSEAFDQAEENRARIHDWLTEEETPERDALWAKTLGVHFTLPADPPELATIGRWGHRESPAVEVHSVRTLRRAGPDGQDLRQLVIEVTQRRRGFLDVARQASEDALRIGPPAPPDFIVRGGATLIVDLRDGTLQYVIRKRTSDRGRLEEQRRFLRGRERGELGFTYRDRPAAEAARSAREEPFAVTHRRA